MAVSNTVRKVLERRLQVEQQIDRLRDSKSRYDVETTLGVRFTDADWARLEATASSAGQSIGVLFADQLEEGFQRIMAN